MKETKYFIVLIMVIIICVTVLEINESYQCNYEPEIQYRLILPEPKGNETYNFSKWIDFEQYTITFKSQGVNESWDIYYEES